VPLEPPAPRVVEPPRPAVAPGLVEPLTPAKPLLPPVPLARPPAPLLPTARQLPWSQTASAEHAVPHRPQLDGSNLVSVHTPSHNEMPGPHGAPFSGESGLRTPQPPRRPAATAIANSLRTMRLRNHIRPTVAIPGHGDRCCSPVYDHPSLAGWGSGFALGYSLPPGAPRRRCACRGITGPPLVLTEESRRRQPHLKLWLTEHAPSEPLPTGRSTCVSVSPAS
jgi:hypothetical protein